jgi:hypothetical protein
LIAITGRKSQAAKHGGVERNGAKWRFRDQKSRKSPAEDRGLFSTPFTSTGAGSSAEAFLLYWPEGWPRTADWRRESDSRFGGSNGLLMGKTRDRLFDELARLGAKSIVVSSNVAGDKLKDDYCVIHEGRSVGRIRLADERSWQDAVWTWNVNVALPSWCNGSTDSLEAAKDEFKAAWGQFYASLTPETLNPGIALRIDLAKANASWLEK